MQAGQAYLSNIIRVSDRVSTNLALTSAVKDDMFFWISGSDMAYDIYRHHET